MYKIINIYRKPPKQDFEVLLCKDRTTNKWCYVNLTSKHVCSCRFDSIEEAMSDLNNRQEVISYKVILEE